MEGGLQEEPVEYGVSMPPPQLLTHLTDGQIIFYYCPGCLHMTRIL